MKSIEVGRGMIIDMVRLGIIDRNVGISEKIAALRSIIESRDPSLIDILERVVIDGVEMALVDWAEDTISYQPEYILDSDFWRDGTWNSPEERREALGAVMGSKYASNVTRGMAMRTLIRFGRKPGFVYFLDSREGFFKIGRTVDPDGRFRQFVPLLPFKTELTHLISCDDYCDAESKLHDRFAEKRSNGEWFRLDESDVESVKDLIGYADGRFITRKEIQGIHYDNISRRWIQPY